MAITIPPIELFPTQFPIQYSPDDVKYKSFNDVIDFHYIQSSYLPKIYPGNDLAYFYYSLNYDKGSEREQIPKYLSVKSSKPFFYVQFDNNIETNNKKLNLRFPGRDTLTIDSERNVLRRFKVEEIGPAFLNKLGGPCEINENFVWNKSECK